MDLEKLIETWIEIGERMGLADLQAFVKEREKRALEREERA